MEKKQIPNRLKYGSDRFPIKEDEIIDKINEIIEFLEDGKK